jgi:hypothetical protein
VNSVVKKLLPIGLILYAVTSANAAPSITIGTSNAARFDMSFIPFETTQLNVEISTEKDCKLATIGRELLKPSVDSADINNSETDYAKVLPPVPPTLLMALTGFICVSLVRDRRIWLAPLAGLLWTGQLGIQALPQLALRLSHRNIEQQISAELTAPYYLADFSRLRSDIEGTRYIGLLHHLDGIPSISLERDSRILQTLTNKFQPALISVQYILNLLFRCCAYRARQHTHFSPAFIFAQMPRGPPKPA